MFWVVGHGFLGQLACSERLSVCRRISAPARCRPPASHLKPTFPINLTSSSRQRSTSLQTGIWSERCQQQEQTGTFTGTRQLPRSESRRVHGMRPFCFVYGGAYTSSGAAKSPGVGFCGPPPVRPPLRPPEPDLERHQQTATCFRRLVPHT